MSKENEIIFIKGCLDCPFYSFDDYCLEEDYGSIAEVSKVQKSWCSALDEELKFYKTNRLPKKCPLRIKDITVSANIEEKE